jgi:hypothetical protein
MDNKTARTIFMMKSEKNTSNAVWLRLRGYRVVALKPDFEVHTNELERAIEEGIPAYPDPARADFYDVVLDDRWAYIHVYRAGHTVYLVARSVVDKTRTGFGTTSISPAFCASR